MPLNNASTPAADTASPLVTLLSQVLPVWSRQLATVRSQSEEAVAEMLGAFAQITPHLAPEQRVHVEQMYESFQHEDRISQIMGLLLQDMQRMHEALSTGDTTIAHGDWLTRLESQYAMAEQRRDHAADGGASNSKSAAAGDDTEFF